MDELCAALVQRLGATASLQPLVAADVEAYGLFELADAVAVRCAASVDPEALRDSELRAQWTKRALEGETMSEPFVGGRSPYWIVADGERIGTIAFAALPAATPTLEISSVYVRPHMRRRGWASRVLQTIQEAAFEVGFKRTSLQVEWNNQDALHFYCAQGMWVAGWKNAIELYFAKDQPRWQLEASAGEARFKVRGRVVAVAHNQGSYLDWSFKKTADKALKQPLEQTAALQLALLQWPIIRSEKLWREQLHKGWSDGGTFEGFALRLRQLERHIRRKRWNLPSERNPSFALLPQPVAASTRGASLALALSDGQQLSVPFEALGLSETDALGDVRVLEDEVICSLQSGIPLILNVDYLLFLTQSPEHLARAAQLVRQASAR
jgi:GNAT superfamily N-acetyltransferase